MISIARSGCFFPTIFTTTSASFSAPPVFSRIEPMRAPRMITIPILVNVPENPAPSMFGIDVSGIPTMIARTRETPISARNGWIFHFEIETMMTAMATSREIIKPMPDI